MRFYDLLCAADPSFPDCPVLVADAVAEDLDQREHGPDFTGYDAVFYDRVAPPFEAFFVEARTTIAEQTVERGVLVRNVTADDRVVQDEHLAQDVTRPATTHWVLTMHAFLRVDEQPIATPMGQAFLHLDHGGYILDPLPLVTLVGYPPATVPPDVPALPLEHLATFVPFALLTVSLLHRRAVVDEVKPYEVISRQVRRQLQRKTGIVLHRHHIVHVGEPKPLAARVARGRPESDVLAMGEHAVRGHFRYYTPDRPLFGRISKLFWIPTHTRGSEEQGTITKDYRIDPTGGT